MEPGQQQDVSDFQTQQDQSQLDLLSILWKVYAGFMCLFICFGGIYSMIGMFGAVAVSAGSTKAESAVLGGVFVVVGVVIMLFAAAKAFLCWTAASNISKRVGHTFCFVMACVICLSMPLGTALGIFTIIVLNRPSVKALFS